MRRRRTTVGLVLDTRPQPFARRLSHLAGLFGPSCMEEKMTGENEFLHNLEGEVEADLAMAESSQPDESAGPAEWLVDPEEAARDEVGLRSLLGAVKAMEEDDATG